MRYEWNLDLLSNNNKWEIEYTNLKKQVNYYLTNIDNLITLHQQVIV